MSDIPYGVRFGTLDCFQVLVTYIMFNGHFRQASCTKRTITGSDVTDADLDAVTEEYLTVRVKEETANDVVVIDADDTNVQVNGSSCLNETNELLEVYLDAERSKEVILIDRDEVEDLNLDEIDLSSDGDEKDSNEMKEEGEQLSSKASTDVNAEMTHETLSKSLPLNQSSPTASLSTAKETAGLNWDQFSPEMLGIDAETFERLKHQTSIATYEHEVKAEANDISLDEALARSLQQQEKTKLTRQRLRNRRDQSSEETPLPHKKRKKGASTQNNLQSAIEIVEGTKPCASSHSMETSINIEGSVTSQFSLDKKSSTTSSSIDDDAESPHCSERGRSKELDELEVDKEASKQRDKGETEVFEQVGVQMPEDGGSAETNQSDEIRARNNNEGGDGHCQLDVDVSDYLDTTVQLENVEPSQPAVSNNKTIGDNNEPVVEDEATSVIRRSVRTKPIVTYSDTKQYRKRGSRSEDKQTSDVSTKTLLPDSESKASESSNKLQTSAISDLDNHLVDDIEADTGSDLDALQSLIDAEADEEENASLEENNEVEVERKDILCKKGSCESTPVVPIKRTKMVKVIARPTVETIAKRYNIVIKRNQRMRLVKPKLTASNTKAPKLCVVKQTSRSLSPRMVDSVAEVKSSRVDESVISNDHAYSQSPKKVRQAERREESHLITHAKQRHSLDVS